MNRPSTARWTSPRSPGTPADALPFPLCLSVERAAGPRSQRRARQHRACRPRADDSPARPGRGARTQPSARGHGDRAGALREAASRQPVPPRFRPALAKAPLTPSASIWRALLAVPISADDGLVAGKLAPRDRRARRRRRASRRLAGTLGTVIEAWTARRDLLWRAARRDRLRGRGRGRRPGAAALRRRRARQRPDPGHRLCRQLPRRQRRAGNVGAEAIAHIVSAANGDVQRCSRNPMPAAGGIEPEDIEAVRRDAPQAFRTQERAVTRGRLRGRRRTPARRAARGRDLPLDGELVHRLRHGRPLRRRRGRRRVRGEACAVTSSASAWRATTSRSTSPRYVPLDVALHICVLPDYFRADVLQAGGACAVERCAAGRPARLLPSRQFHVRRSRSISAGSSRRRRRSRASSRCVPTVSSAWATRSRPRSTTA